MTTRKHLCACTLMLGLIIVAIGCGTPGPLKLAKVASATAPSAPTGLTATASNGSVSLSWTASTGATSYNVYYSTSNSLTTANGTKVSAISGTTSTISSLTSGTMYYFIVTAQSAAGESTASTMVNAMPVPSAPATPAGLTATAGDASVSVSWTASTGATSYNLYYSTTNNVTTANGTKVGSLSGTTYTLSSLTNGTAYYIIVTAQNAGGESPASTMANATPAAAGGSTTSLTPAQAATATVDMGSSTSLSFNFPANAVSQDAVATISPIAQSGLPLPLTRSHRPSARLAPRVAANDTFIAAFSISLNPVSITKFNVPVTVGGSVPTTIPINKTINLALLSNNSWVDVATFVVGTNGSITQNLVSVSQPGLINVGTYLLYLPATGTNTTVSNLGVALMADDSETMADGKNGLQVIHLYDANGNLLTTPLISYLDYDNAYDLDGSALTPDGSQGIMVDGGNTVRFFSAVQTGVPIAATNTVDVGAYGGDGDSIAILPNGNEAVVSADGDNELVIVSGILSGNPVAAATITVPGYRDGLVIAPKDGSVMLARGYSGLTVIEVTHLSTPVAGSITGQVENTYTVKTDLSSLGVSSIEDGREGMAISPTDSSRAVVVNDSDGSVNLLTGLPASAAITSTVTPTNTGTTFTPDAVSITPDGKYAIVGGESGLLLFSGVDTGTLTQVGPVFRPKYQLSATAVGLGTVTTLGITLDGKYVVAGDYDNQAIIVVPFSATGFSNPAAVLEHVAVSYNDQLLIH